MSLVLQPLEPRRLCSATFLGPIVITKGGTYSGHFESRDRDVPVIRIKTTEPVTITNSVLRGRGDLIRSTTLGANITVTATQGYGMNPQVLGKPTGRFLEVEKPARLYIASNYLSGTAGMYVYKYGGHHLGAQTYRFLGNTAKNIDGRRSDGAGGYMTYNDRALRDTGERKSSGYEQVQFLQLDQVHSVAGIEIAGNKITNEPGNSRVEDNISIFKSSGTAASPIRIHDNEINGAYTISPASASTANKTWRYDWSYTGGGIMLGDGLGATPSEDPGCIACYNNTIVNTTNFGIAISAGHDITFFNNKVGSTGRLADGRTIFAQNVGVYIWNMRKAPATRFFNNTAHNNVISWLKNGIHNDWWVPDATSFVNNRSA